MLTAAFARLAEARAALVKRGSMPRRALVPLADYMELLGVYATVESALIYDGSAGQPSWICGGREWECTYCGGMRRDAEACWSCGASRRRDDQRAAPPPKMRRPTLRLLGMEVNVNETDIPGFVLMP